MRSGKAAGLLALSLMATWPIGQAGADTPSGREISETARWVVRADSTLRATLQAWTAREGWELVWDAERDYRIRASADLGPEFMSAIRALADAVNQTSPDLTVTLYLGNRVVHVRDTMRIEN